ncbi:two-component system sensor histidine kinase CreC [Psychrobacter lutiphocae]|uniref:two-component system sensor histidine kinase CreC n=1 Tax=Psychrobacter lutiphocae TaxID=540500 RepID=UPI0003736E27|nr:two-component system sensor histidine kinase CreC [Psychrobacter lutiphocae]
MSKHPIDPNSSNGSNSIYSSNSIHSSNSSSQQPTTPNWYAKLHPIGKDSSSHSTDNKPKKILNLSLFFRIWIAVGIIVIISGIVVFNQLFTYVRPITQQVIEDTLVDTSKLLSASLQSAVESGDIYNPSYQAMLDQAFTTPSLPTKNPDNSALSSLNSDTWYHQKTHSSFRVYITDNHGIVIYDSLPKQGDSINPKGNAEGDDYSNWNDVNLTLQGKYGARTTRTDPEDSASSVMYVAQPIYSSDGHHNIIAVVSVGKPTVTVLPYLDATRKRMLSASLIISIVTLIMAGLVAWWLRQSTLLVTRYTQSLAQDTKKPYFYLGRELNELTDTIESMKHRLENRAYVTDYVHTLTHELKSPLTAIRASGELLEETDLDSEDRQMLSQTITEQSIKLHSLIDRLLLLAKIEQPNFRLAIQPIHPDALIKTLVAGCKMQRQYQHLEIDYQSTLDLPEHSMILADEFWLTQALQNVLDNALYFAHNKVLICLSSWHLDKTPYIKLSVINDGNLIPDYALNKVFDRYFSLSHQYQQGSSQYSQSGQQNNQPSTRLHSPAPNTQGKKGTGLGLTLVKQVIERHGGQVSIHNLTSAEAENVKKTIIDKHHHHLVTDSSITHHQHQKHLHQQQKHLHQQQQVKKQAQLPIETGVELVILLPIAPAQSV